MKLSGNRFQKQLDAELVTKSTGGSIGFLLTAWFVIAFKVGGTEFFEIVKNICFLIIGLNAWRFSMNIAHRKLKNPTDRFYKIFKFNVVVNAFCWGAVNTLVFWSGDTNIYLSTYLGFVFVLGAGGVTTLSAAPRIQVFYFFCNAFLPAAAIFIKSTYYDVHADQLTIAVLLFIGFVFSIIQARQFYSHSISRYEYEEIISSEREHLQSIIDSIPGFIMNLASDLKVISISKDITQYLGKDFLNIKTLSSASHPAARYIQSFTASDKKFLTEEVEFNGAWFLVSSLKQAGKDILFSGIPIDELIKARKDLDDQTLKAMNSSKLASLGEMAAGVGHEINNPVAIMSGYATEIRLLLQKQAADREEKILEKSDKIVKAAQRVKKIVSSLRLLSRDATKDPMEMTPLQVIVDDTLPFCYEKFTQAGVNLSIQPIPEEAVIPCRPTQVSQVLLNILNNAYDAVLESPNPKKEVNVGFKIVNNNVNISISDSGVGIAEDIKEKVFEPFFTTKSVGKGTGLGLSISKNIMSEHHGKLSFESQKGQTTFVLEFPKDQKAA